MSMNRFASKVILPAVLMFFTVACGFAGLGATPTPTLTSTPVPTSTSTPRPTATPRPTYTSTPTPAPVGSAVTYKSLEITVIDVKNRESVHFGDISGNMETFYKPNPGSFLIDVGVLVHNNSSSSYRTPWGNIYIIEENGDAWYPYWGNIKAVSSDKKIDPFTIGLSSTPLNADDVVELGGNTYLRLIFGVKDNPQQNILFMIDDSAPIIFQPGK